MPENAQHTLIRHLAEHEPATSDICNSGGGGQASPIAFGTSRSKCVLLTTSLAIGLLVTVLFGSTRSTHRAATVDVPDVLNLGSGQAGDSLRGRLPLTNKTDRALRFRIESGCACALIEPREGSVAANETEWIHVGLRLRYAGRDQQAYLRIALLDPPWRNVGLWVIGHCPSPIVADPEIVDFGSLLLGTNPSKRVRLRAGQEAKALAQQDLQLHVPSDRIHAELETESSGQVVLSVSLRPPSEPGDFHSVLQVQLADGTSMLEIPVTASVVPKIMVAPRTLQLEDGRKGAYSSTFLVWRPDGQRLEKPAVIEAPPGIVVQPANSNAGLKHCYRVVVEEPRRLPRASAIRLRFGEETVEVRISGNVGRND